MIPELVRSEPGTQGMRRIARAQMEKAIEALESQTLSDENVHVARKELKKARATLRLLRPALGKTLYTRENTTLRDAAQPLGRVRDGTALLATLTKLEGRFGSLEQAASVERLKHALRRERTSIRREILKGVDLDTYVAALKGVYERAARWHVGDQGWSTVGQGFEQVYGKGRKALAKAEGDRTPTNLHEWRKHVKYLWHQLQTLQPLWPGLIGELADQAHQLADYLGDDHDLSVLRARIVFDKDAFRTPGSHGPLLAVIDRWRGELRDKAMVLGRRLYQEKPGAFESRFGQYWRDWQRKR
ncbi:MAG TPA: CHAD domain-containing protein [Steroidobacteraceae bacterium]|jgi:CHAD domain-containing protein